MSVILSLWAKSLILELAGFLVALFVGFFFELQRLCFKVSSSFLEEGELKGTVQATLRLFSIWALLFQFPY